MPLVLGDVEFTDFEIPEKITGLGGKQMLAKHKLLGGARVLDAMGPDEGDPSWSGTFRGSQAEVRAFALDEIRKAGQPVDLSFGQTFLSVIVEEFEYSFERAYQIPYRIKVAVVPQDVGGDDASIDDQVNGDLDSADGEAGNLQDAA